MLRILQSTDNSTLIPEVILTGPVIDNDNLLCATDLQAD